MIQGYWSTEHTIYTIIRELLSKQHQSILDNKTNEDLRILYLLGLITISKMGDKAYLRWRIFSLLREEIHLFEGFRARIAEFFNLLASNKTIEWKKVKDITTPFDTRTRITSEIIKFYNEHPELNQIKDDLLGALQSIGNRYDVKPYRVNDDFSFTEKRIIWTVRSGYEELDNFIKSIIHT